MSTENSPVEHVIVLMLENRSYDHMLGYLERGEKLTGNEFNLVDPLDPQSEQVYVSDTSGYITLPNPSHDVISVEKQMYGQVGKIVDPAPMSGFVAVQTQTAKGSVELGKKITQSFDPVNIPTLTTLAREFVLCDHWHASVPGPTWPNRFFAHAATSDGVCSDDAWHAFQMKTIYDSLSQNELSWNVYYGDIPQSILLKHEEDKLGHFKMFHTFFEDLEKGTLPTYSFIEPRFIDFLRWKATDQHPPHDVRMGEYLIAEVYDTLRLSSYWEKMLLVVLYDEHGGFYDHVPPPGVPNPDGKVSVNPPFDFTRLGVRVPAVLVSPWVEKGRVDSTLYEHASIPATLHNMFNLAQFLTARDQAANTFEKNLSRSSPRTDAPTLLPVPGDRSEVQQLRKLLHVDAHAQALLHKLSGEDESHAPLTLFQQSLVELADRLNNEARAGITPKAGLIDLEHAAAVHVGESIRHFLEGG